MSRPVRLVPSRRPLGGFRNARAFSCQPTEATGNSGRAMSGSGLLRVGTPVCEAVGLLHTPFVEGKEAGLDARSGRS